MYVAFGEGTDAVFSILDGSRRFSGICESRNALSSVLVRSVLNHVPILSILGAAEFRERVKAVVLLDGTTGDKRKDKLDRAWLNRVCCKRRFIVYVIVACDMVRIHMCTFFSYSYITDENILKTISFSMRVRSWQKTEPRLAETEQQSRVSQW
jgi:DNA-directed RNA polymerase subunit N (RpoN/RPB10)